MWTKHYKFIFLGLCFAIFAVTIPLQRYIGDPVANRLPIYNWLKTGSYEVPKEQAISFGEDRHTFTQNQQTLKIFPRWPEGNALAMAPPVVFSYFLWGVPENLPSEPAEFISVMGWYAACISILIAAIWFAIAEQYTSDRRLQVFFVFISIFASFYWTLLRYQSSEPFHVLLLSLAFLFWLRFLQADGDGKAVPGQSALIVVASCLVLLVSLRIAYLLFYPGFFLSLWMARGKYASLQRGFGKKMLLICVAALLLPVLSILLLNAWKYGSAFDLGYNPKVFHEQMHPRNLLKSIPGFLIYPDRSVFLHVPLLFLAVLGWREYLKKYPLHAVFLLATFLPYFVFVGSLEFWTGEWCYGPRLLQAHLALLSIPALFFLRDLLALNGTKKIAARASLLIICSIWIRGQMYINEFNIFSYYRIRERYVGAKLPEVDEYFLHKNWLLFYRDIHALYCEGRDLPITRIVAASYGEEKAKFIQTSVKQSIAPNIHPVLQCL